MRKETTYTKVKHYAAKTVNSKYGSTSEQTVVELFIALLMGGLSAFGYVNGFLILFLLCGAVSIICLLAVLISGYQSLSNYAHKKRQAKNG